MADNMKEIEALPQSTSANSPAHGAFIQNMFRRQNALETRPGWGQIGQFDSTLGLSASAHGYQKVLGTYVMKTDFGHVQIATVLYNRSFTGQVVTRGYWQNCYSIVIFDKTTRQVWEEVLVRHTSEQNAIVTSPTTYRGVYETNHDQDFASLPQYQEGQVWMQEYQDALYFGSPSMGIWVYTPADFAGRNNVQLNGIRKKDWAPTFGESALVQSVSASPGMTQAAAAYLDSGGFPTVQSAAVIDNRLCYASGRSVYFTDPGFVGSIRATNILQVPCEDVLTHLIEYSGNLYLFTQRETWLYQPNVGDVIANGRLTKISGSVGCASVYGAVRAGSALYWMDARGVYTMRGLFDIETVSTPIKNLFDPGVGVANPYTNFLTNQGMPDLFEQQQRTFLYADATEVVMAYDPLFRQIIMAFPSQNGAWVFQEGAWLYWTFDTVVTSGNLIHTNSNISNVWPLALDGTIYGVAGPEVFTPVDQTKTGGVTPAPENEPTSSFYILQAGVGGGVDRTVSAQQDNRLLAGYFEQYDEASEPNGYIRVGQSWQAPLGYTFPTNPSGASVGTYVYPVYISPTTTVDNVQLALLFDNTNWTPVFRDNTTSTEVDIIIPAARRGGIGGWRFGSPILNQATCQCFDVGTGLPSRNGNILLFQWNAGDAAPGVMPFNHMNIPTVRESLWFYFPLKKKGLQNTAMSAGFAGTAKIYVSYGEDRSLPVSLYVWHQAYTPNLHKLDDTAQPIDWVAKTDQLGLDGQNQVKSRGLYLRMVDHGRDPGGLATSWPYSTFNVISAADLSDYSGQLKDFGAATGLTNLGAFAHPEHLVTKDTIRDRINTITGLTAGQIAPKEFNNVAATWGSSGSANGSVLVDNQQYDTRAISSHVRGETVSWMMFGHMRSPAEKIVLDSAKVTVKDVGTRRRRGR